MKFRCERCRTKYQVSDTKVRGKILTIRCKKCSSEILLRESLHRTDQGGVVIAPVVLSDLPKSSAAKQIPISRTTPLAAVLDTHNSRESELRTAFAPTPSLVGTAGLEWYAAVDGEKLGPYAFPEVVRRVSSGELVGSNYVWHDGMDEWERIRDVPDVARHLGASFRSRPPPTPAPLSSFPGDPKDEGGQVLDFEERRVALKQSRPAAITLDDPVLIPTPKRSAESFVALSTTEVVEHADEPLRLEALLAFDEAEASFGEVAAAALDSDPAPRQRGSVQFRLGLGALVVFLLAGILGVWATGVVDASDLSVATRLISF